MTTKLTKVPVPAVGPRPEGNPEEMERLAHQCRTYGRSLQSGCLHAKHAVDPDRMDFKGRSAVAIRASVGRNSHHAGGVAHALEAFATNLEAGASELRGELKAYGDRVQRAEDAKAHNRQVDDQNTPPSAADLEFGF